MRASGGPGETVVWCSGLAVEKDSGFRRQQQDGEPFVRV
jgi:hypothetical protein